MVLDYIWEIRNLFKYSTSGYTVMHKGFCIQSIYVDLDQTTH